MLELLHYKGNALVTTAVDGSIFLNICDDNLREKRLENNFFLGITMKKL